LTAGADRLQVSVESENGRYHRQELISWWDQERLARAKVLVVGAGAIGNELLKNLALLGVGKVLVIDMDRIENSNLSRCVLFRESDEGRYKAEVAAEGARALNPSLQIGAVVGDVRVDLGLGVFEAADVVLGGLDNREARLHINQNCWKVGTPWIDGAIEGLLGVMRVFVPPRSACYECTMNERDHEVIAARKSCALLTREQMLAGKVPTTATSASVIAGMQAEEAVKLLHRGRIDTDFAGHGFAYNGLTHDSYVVTYPFREDCLSHDSYDLAEAAATSADVSFGELLDRASAELEDPVLDLEREIVLAFECASCGAGDPVRVPVERLTARCAVCPSCGADRAPRLTHVISATDYELLALTPADLGLPRFDVITARAGLTRRHFRLEGDVDVFEELVQ
jgi:molybdopterin/thiamine biosynthesis adenylyltransferase